MFKGGTDVKSALPIFFTNNFVNLGELGKLYLTSKRKNDKLGNTNTGIGRKISANIVIEQKGMLG